MGDDYDDSVKKIMDEYLKRQTTNSFDVGKGVLNNGDPDKLKYGKAVGVSNEYWATEQMMRDSMEAIKNDMYNQQKKSMYERSVEKIGREAVDNVLGMMYEIAMANSKVEVLMVLIDQPESLTYTGFLDKNPYVHECLQDGYLERHCDRGAHYYIVTKDGRLAVDMEHL